MTNVSVTTSLDDILGQRIKALYSDIMRDIVKKYSSMAEKEFRNKFGAELSRLALSTGSSVNIRNDQVQLTVTVSIPVESLTGRRP